MTESSVSQFTIVDRNTIRFERTFPVPIETAWDYLTRRDMLNLWLADGIIEQRVGGRVDIQFAEAVRRDDPACHNVGTVLEWNPPTRLSYTWEDECHNGPDEGSYMVFELAPVAGGTKLTLTHKRLDSEKLHIYGAGWHAHFHVMAARVAGTDPAAFSVLYDQLLAIYEQIVKGGN
jgi:uncharacterized protein YndB with AHSA1/START domain